MCKATFSEIEELLAHSESCTGSPPEDTQGFICPECKAAFSDPDTLIDHVQSTHNSAEGGKGAAGVTIAKLEREIDDLFGGQDLLGMGKDKAPVDEGELPWIDELKKHETQFQRKQALIEFYKTREPSKLDAVDNILSNYSFRDVVTSLKKTYGEVPLGWEKELGWFSSGA